MIREMTLNEAATICRGTAMNGGHTAFGAVSTDSRNIIARSLFVALRGEHCDGHDYVCEALSAGAAAAMVDRPLAIDKPFLQVSDSLLAVQRLAAQNRLEFNGPVVALTGSAGKTSCKELIAIVLAGLGSVLKTTGNRNNHLGVPLTLLELDRQHAVLVIELGAAAGGEIALLAQLTRPDVALITNAGAAHLQGFGDIDGVIQGKGEILDALPTDGIAVLPSDDAAFDQWCRRAGSRRIISFGRSLDSDIRLLSAKQFSDSSQPSTAAGTGEQATGMNLCFEIGGTEFEFPVSLQGRHNAINVAAALAVATAFELDIATVASGLKHCRLPAGRLQQLRAEQPLIIDDSYNANPVSVAAAIALLSEKPSPCWLILAEMTDLGADSSSWHRRIGAQVASAGIENFWCCGGPAAAAAAAGYGTTARYFSSQADLLRALDDPPHCNSLLIKGSRVTAMEKVADAVLSYYHKEE